MNKLKMLYFGAGLVTGAITSAIAAGVYFKKKYSKELEKEISDLETYYGTSEKYKRHPEPEEKELQTDLAEIASERSASGRKRVKDEDKKESKETDYRNFYDGKVTEEHRDAVEDPDPEVEEDIKREEESWDAWHDEHKDLPCKVITEEEIAEIPFDLDQEILYFWEGDGEMSDEDENWIDEPGHLVGTALDEVDFADEDTIYVINYALDTIYEIHRKPRRFWSEETDSDVHN